MSEIIGYFHSKAFDCKVAVHKARYQTLNKTSNTGNTAIFLKDADTGEPIAKLSVNTGVPLHLNEFVCKNYAENKVIAKEAFASGLFEDTGVLVTVGFCECPIWAIKE